MRISQPSLALWLFVMTTTCVSNGNAFSIVVPATITRHGVQQSRSTPNTICVPVPNSSCLILHEATSSNNAAEAAAPTTPPPVLNGKMVLPFKVIQKGLAGHHQVAAVYALLSSEYKKGTKGWEHVVSVGTTLDLESKLNDDLDVAYVRALSFSFPQRDAMEDVARQWRDLVQEAGGTLDTDKDKTDDLLRQAQLNALSAFDDEDDDDDDDDDIDMMMPPPPSLSSLPTSATDVISPFAEGASGLTNRDLPFTIESVNLVLEEVRPYLIADGGNVSVDRVDEETKNIYLKLEGACGSCPSSTVTMQMGIERVLKENFSNLGQVIQVNDGGVEKPSELTMDMVMIEINRIGPAISAMGGNYELVNVDPIGVVELKFKGPNKLQQGLELALLDIPLCKHVKFTMFDE